MNTAGTDAQAGLSGKGDVLIFNSNRPGTIGMTDLSVATREKLEENE